MGFARQAGYRRAMAEALEQSMPPRDPQGYRRTVDRITI
jgi:hypothetical protein